MAGVDHYENFPVASWLCPPELRPPIIAIYRFARTADDIADEGSDTPSVRLDRLGRYRRCLRETLNRCDTNGAERPGESEWGALFRELGQQVEAHRLPHAPLFALLDAFEQDVRYTANGRLYANTAELLDYCSRSADPIGRLLLHLYGVDSPEALRESDAICTGLQLINFWQDIGLDLKRERRYIPTDAMQRHGLTWADLRHHTPIALPQAQALVKELVEDACTRLHEGAALCHRLPGRAGWELRLVVQGGLRIAHKIRRLDWRTWQQRPTLSPIDGLAMLGAACRMKRPAGT